MSESFFEDLNDAFPINSQVRCGQAAFRLGFAHMTLDDSEQLQPAHLQRSKKRPLHAAGSAQEVIPLQQNPAEWRGFLLPFLDPPHGIAG
ncbi:hypothetical protein PPS11_25520 [Pseudomonas putida S11]|nr:hypothetical protein PPS11_25520 [Pseudomonas putida S11]